jgi:hypothetical protein
VFGGERIGLLSGGGRGGGSAKLPNAQRGG